jgi:hypothetical protein
MVFLLPSSQQSYLFIYLHLQSFMFHPKTTFHISTFMGQPSP